MKAGLVLVVLVGAGLSGCAGGDPPIPPEDPEELTESCVKDAIMANIPEAVLIRSQVNTRQARWHVFVPGNAIGIDIGGGYGQDVRVTTSVWPKAEGSPTDHGEGYRLTGEIGVTFERLATSDVKANTIHMDLHVWLGQDLPGISASDGRVVLDDAADSDLDEQDVTLLAGWTQRTESPSPLPRTLSLSIGVPALVGSDNEPRVFTVRASGTGLHRDTTIHGGTYAGPVEPVEARLPTPVIDDLDVADSILGRAKSLEDETEEVTDEVCEEVGVLCDGGAGNSDEPEPQPGVVEKYAELATWHTGAMPFHKRTEWQTVEANLLDRGSLSKEGMYDLPEAFVIVQNPEPAESHCNQDKLRAWTLAEFCHGQKAGATRLAWVSETRLAARLDVHDGTTLRNPEADPYHATLSLDVEDLPTDFELDVWPNERINYNAKSGHYVGSLWLYHYEPCGLTTDSQTGDRRFHHLMVNAESLPPEAQLELESADGSGAYRLQALQPDSIETERWFGHVDLRMWSEGTRPPSTPPWAAGYANWVYVNTQEPPIELDRVQKNDAIRVVVRDVKNMTYDTRPAGGDGGFFVSLGRPDPDTIEAALGTTQESLAGLFDRRRADEGLDLGDIQEEPEDLKVVILGYSFQLGAMVTDIGTKIALDSREKDTLLLDSERRRLAGTRIHLHVETPGPPIHEPGTALAPCPPPDDRLTSTDVPEFQIPHDVSNLDGFDWKFNERLPGSGFSYANGNEDEVEYVVEWSEESEEESTPTETYYDPDGGGHAFVGAPPYDCIAPGGFGEDGKWRTFNMNDRIDTDAPVDVYIDTCADGFNSDIRSCRAVDQVHVTSDTVPREVRFWQMGSQAEDADHDVIRLERAPDQAFSVGVRAMSTGGRLMGTHMESLGLVLEDLPPEAQLLISKDRPRNFDDDVDTSVKLSATAGGLNLRAQGQSQYRDPGLFRWPNADGHIFAATGTNNGNVNIQGLAVDVKGIKQVHACLPGADGEILGLCTGTTSMDVTLVEGEPGRAADMESLVVKIEEIDARRPAEKFAAMQAFVSRDMPSEFKVDITNEGPKRPAHGSAQVPVDSLEVTIQSSASLGEDHTKPSDDTALHLLIQNVAESSPRTQPDGPKEPVGLNSIRAEVVRLPTEGSLRMGPWTDSTYRGETENLFYGDRIKYREGGDEVNLVGCPSHHKFGWMAVEADSKVIIKDLEMFSFKQHAHRDEMEIGFAELLHLVLLLTPLAGSVALAYDALDIEDWVAEWGGIQLQDSAEQDLWDHIRARGLQIAPESETGRLDIFSCQGPINFNDPSSTSYDPAEVDYGPSDDQLANLALMLTPADFVLAFFRGIGYIVDHISIDETPSPSGYGAIITKDYTTISGYVQSDMQVSATGVDDFVTLADMDGPLDPETGRPQGAGIRQHHASKSIIEWQGFEGAIDIHGRLEVDGDDLGFDDYPRQGCWYVWSKNKGLFGDDVSAGSRQGDNSGSLGRNTLACYAHNDRPGWWDGPPAGVMDDVIP